MAPVLSSKCFQFLQGFSCNPNKMAILCEQSAVNGSSPKTPQGVLLNNDCYSVSLENEEDVDLLFTIGSELMKYEIKGLGAVGL
jgi:hypothetical protein